MSLFKKLTSAFGKGKIKKEQEDELKNILSLAIRDGEISESEKRDLDSFFLNSDLSEQDYDRIKTEAFNNAVQWLTQDRRVDPGEAKALENIASALNISPQEWNKVSSHLNFYFTLNEIEQGRLPQISFSNIILQNDEVGHFVCPANLMEEKVVSRRTVGSSGGVRIRIAKGVSYRVGSAKGRIESQTALLNVSEGSFAITNKRFIFSGNRKSASIEFKKLLDFQIYSDAIQFSVTNRQKPIFVGIPNYYNVEMSAVIISRIINQ